MESDVFRKKRMNLWIAWRRPARATGRFFHLLSFLNPFSLSFFLSIRPHKYIIPVHGYAANCNLCNPYSQLILFRKNRAVGISSVFPETVSVTFPELVIFTIPYSASKNNPQPPYHIYQILNTLFIQNNEFAFL